MDVLLLRLDAPMMSFGDVAVDQRRPVGEYPALSLLVGLLGNALGYHRYETHLLMRLQERLRFAVRIDRRGTQFRDYQTVALDTLWMLGTKQGVGWTTHGRVEERGGGKVDTHIRQRDFWADRIVTLALALDPPDESPVIPDLAAAIKEPARPLFIGRKSCLPAAPLLLEYREFPSLLAAIEQVPRATRADSGSLLASWSVDNNANHWIEAWDMRDWPNQIHAGSRRIVTGSVDPPEAP